MITIPLAVTHDKQIVNGEWFIVGADGRTLRI
jgi:hypothetical protein